MKRFFIKCLQALLVTGITLGVLFLLKEGVVRPDTIFGFWIRLLPIVISVFTARWIYVDCQKRSIPHPFFWSFTALGIWIIVLPIYLFYRRRFPDNKRSKLRQNNSPDVALQNSDKSFVKVFNAYFISSILIGFLIIVLFVLKFPINQLNPFDYFKQDEIFKEQAANQPPPKTLSIGGLGTVVTYHWDSNLKAIPPGYHYKRTDLRGYKIYIPRGDSIIQWKESEQYNEVIVENPGKWISLYRAKMPMR